MKIDWNTTIAYREVFFRDEVGKAVLLDVLNDLGVMGNHLATDEDRILHNAGKLILAKLGVALPEQFENQIEAWARMPMPEKPKEEQNNG